jgi:hypothetical protein
MLKNLLWVTGQRSAAQATAQYMAEGNLVTYWIQLQAKYPALSQFAINIMTIPASSCDCERLFSELVDVRQ